MSHARTQIRDAIATAVTGLATTGTRIYKTRVYPNSAAAIPGLCIYTLAEELVAATGPDKALQLRRLTCRVEARCKPGVGTNLDDQMDAICLEVEEAITGAAALAALLCSAPELQGTEMSISGKAERPVGRATMNWACLYKVQASAPDTLV